MIEEGEQAPSFELSGVIEGRPGRVSLDSFLGDSVVVLAFYPADFNPSCTDQSTDLDEFDVFRMQSDATVLAISGDSLFSHRAFARKHDLRLPLLADIDSEVARAYGVESGDGRYPNHRAVVVIDNDGQVTYTWLAENIEDRPNIEEVQAAFSAVGDANLAETQYRHGCGRYADGRSSFVTGMDAYRQRDWVLARGEFETSLNELAAAEDAYRRAIRFSETDAMTTSYERAERIVKQFGRAVDLLSDAASAHASSDGSRAKQLREEAQGVLTDVRGLGAPPNPDELPVDTDADTSAGESLPALDVEFDAAAGEETPAAVGDSQPAGASAGVGRLTGSEETGPTDHEETPAERQTDQSGEIDDDDNIDEEELEALTAEIETQDASGDDENGNNG
jgi:peroxiredoxin